MQILTVVPVAVLAVLAVILLSGNATTPADKSSPAIAATTTTNQPTTPSTGTRRGSSRRGKAKKAKNRSKDDHHSPQPGRATQPAKAAPHSASIARDAQTGSGQTGPSPGISEPSQTSKPTVGAQPAPAPTRSGARRLGAENGSSYQPS